MEENRDLHSVGLVSSSQLTEHSNQGEEYGSTATQPKPPLTSTETESESTTESEGDEEDELNRMISNIGFGRYHRRVLMLCGLGWLADNMWMQCTACILPRVQQHFGVSNSKIGIMSSCMFLGLMCGALSWGPLSDRFGRLIAYRWTLVVSGTFGALAAAMPNFGLLCVCLFGLGSGVGGNMPVDGAIFLEFVPREKRHLLTLLSVFFSIGSVVTSAVALALVPPFSCPDEGPCDVSKQNNGWRYLLVTMALCTFVMVILRNGCFRLYESPKYLLQNNRRSDVVMVLKKVAKFNHAKRKKTTTTRAQEDEGEEEEEEERVTDELAGYNGGERMATHDTTSENAWLEWPEEETDEGEQMMSATPERQRQRRPPGAVLRGWAASWKHKLQAMADFRSHQRQLKPLFAPSIRRTTLLVWAIWAVVALGFTMFNVFLPKLLETRATAVPDGTTKQGSKQVQVYRDALIYAVSGIPGSILGAWMVDTRLGRIYSMALATFVSGLALIAFALTAQTHNTAWTIVSSSAFGLMSTLMFAVIYAYTPEVFHPKIRGTACGLASALGRVAGIIAPLITGLLLEISTTVPLVHWDSEAQGRHNHGDGPGRRVPAPRSNRLGIEVHAAFQAHPPNPAGHQPGAQGAEHGAHLRVPGGAADPVPSGSQHQQHNDGRDLLHRGHRDRPGHADGAGAAGDAGGGQLYCALAGGRGRAAQDPAEPGSGSSRGGRGAGAGAGGEAGQDAGRGGDGAAGQTRAVEGAPAVFRMHCRVAPEQGPADTEHGARKRQRGCGDPPAGDVFCAAGGVAGQAPAGGPRAAEDGAAGLAGDPQEPQPVCRPVPAPADAGAADAGGVRGDGQAGRRSLERAQDGSGAGGGDLQMRGGRRGVPRVAEQGGADPGQGVPGPRQEAGDALRGAGRAGHAGAPDRQGAGGAQRRGVHGDAARGAGERGNQGECREMQGRPGRMSEPAGG